MQTELEKGLALCNRLHGEHTGAEIVGALKDICPDLYKMTMEWSFAGIFARPGLDLKTRELVVIASCVSQGFMPQLKAHIEAALTAGCTKQEIVETILQMLPYTGFAAVTNAMILAKEVLA